LINTNFPHDQIIAENTSDFVHWQKHPTVFAAGNFFTDQAIGERDDAL
jgi:hypothetical protein